MGLKSSIVQRAKTLVKKEELSLISSRNKVSSTDLSGISMDLIQIMETALNYKKEANILLDIGSHHGKFSSVANIFTSFEKTICFEPNEAMHPFIQKHNNQVDLSIVKTAMSDKKGTTVFHLHEDSTMNSILNADAEVLKSEFPWDNPDLMTSTEVPTDTLDNYINENNLGNNTFFVKIDTQGNELNVLRNAMKTLEQTEVILIEYMFLSPYETDFSFFELLQFLNEKSFDCKGALTISKRPSKKVSAVDFIFVKRD